jgi:DNA-binding winged helix-turn-helix (wHTH) protein/tetratricopeptide (TPR) repeat protein
VRGLRYVARNLTGIRYASHHVVLEPGRWQVRIGDEIVTPEPKVFELLSYLMRHAGRVVSKAELLDSLWSGDVVGESVLTRCVSCARKLLADDSKTPRFIRTLHGRGYEFIAPVSTFAPGAPEREPPLAATTAPGSLARPAPSAERPFVGRRAEVRRLGQALQQLEARRGDFVVVSGEPGIGKTRLLEEALAAAPPAVDVHLARCSALEGAPAFLVWHDCFRSIVRSRSIKVVLRAFEDAPSAARKLLLGTERWRLEDQLGWDSPAERFRTFDAVGRGLAQLAEQRPLALVFDDLHAADLVSLLLLEFLTQTLSAPVLLLAATRDAEPTRDRARAEALARLRDACKSELCLAGLGLQEVRQLVELRVGGATEELAASLLSRTGGNPFFLSVLAQGADGARVQEAQLPSAVQKAVAQRLAALDEPCLALLQTAAVCGQSFDALVVSRAVDLPYDTCLSLLTAAGAARLVAQSGTSEYRFIHDLIREVLMAQLSPPQKPLLHLAVGRALAALPSFQDARHAATLAHHFVEAAHFGGAAQALDLSIRAGAYALRNLAYEAAVEHFTRASKLLALNERDPATECAVLLDLGLSEISAGRREAGQKARELGGASELSAVALNLAPGLFAIETGVYDPALVGLLREALEQAGHADPKRRALLLGRLALALYWADTFDERVAICREAHELAERVGTDDVRAEVATAQLFGLLRPGNLEERRKSSEHALELCRRAGDHHGLLMNRVLRAAMCLEVGDRAAARFEHDAFRQLAETTNQPQSLWIVHAHRACQLLMDGELGEVERLAQACLVSGQRVRDHNALLTFGVHLTLVRIEQARATEVLDVIRDYAARYPRILGWRVLYCYALGRAERMAECRAEYESLRSSGFALPDDLNWMVSMSWLADTCRALNDTASARLLHERLAPFAERMVVIGYGIGCVGSVERCLAVLAATAGDVPEAKRHFERALAKNRRADATLPLIQTLCDFADCLSAAGDDAGAQRCREEAAPLIRARNLVALGARLAPEFTLA